jgi:2-acylglycerol O-acyltransferase 2
MDYFKHVELIIEDGQLKETKSLICQHPHGIVGVGFTMSIAFNDVLYKTFHCGSRSMLNLPISGIFARLLGLVGVDQNTFKDLMKKGKNLRFIPGGFEEATLTNSEKDRVFINSRKGFIKYALQNGYTLYPSYTFNENKIYNTINCFEKFRLWLNKLKLPGALFYGRFFFLPKQDIELITVIGKGFELPVITSPTKEEINKYHGLYVEQLKQLYDRYKEKYGASSELEIL